MSTSRNFNEQSESFGLSLGDGYLGVGVFLVTAFFLQDTPYSLLSIVVSGVFLGTLAQIRIKNRRKIIRDKLWRVLRGEIIYDPRDI